MDGLFLGRHKWPHNACHYSPPPLASPLLCLVGLSCRNDFTIITSINVDLLLVLLVVWSAVVVVHDNKAHMEAATQSIQQLAARTVK